MACLLLGRSRSGVGVRVGVDIFMPESEVETLKLRRLRSPGREALKAGQCNKNQQRIRYRDLKKQEKKHLATTQQVK